MPDTPWPKAPAIYQIYPRSFQDTNGDGIGDLPGILSRLDHVAGLGVDAIWLSPHYVSPWADGGYDVADHRAVDPRLGTLADFDALVARAHDLGLRVMIDQVLNHTSCEHPWFLAALEGCEAKARRYLFCDPKPDGTQPNNWIAQFGTPAWSWSHKRRQFYFHQFLSCQPSLDLRNPEVQAAHCEQIAFWRDRGVDGFRFDAVTSYLWDPSLDDNPPASPEVQAKVAGQTFIPYTYQDHLHDMLPGDGAAYMENVRGWAGDQTWLMGEITSGNKSVELAMEFSAPGRLDACYTTDLPVSGGAPKTVADMAARADLHRLVGWLTSHDQPRHGSGDADRAAVQAVLMALLPGPWLIYQGEEWGLPQPELAKEVVTDPLDLLYWPDGPGREGSRVPIPWDPAAPAFGFTGGKPWLPMDWDREALRRAKAPGGLEDLYRQVIGLRRKLGWDRATLLDCTAEDTRLELEVASPHGRFRGVFSFGSVERPDAPGEDLIAVGGGSSWGSVRRTAEPEISVTATPPQRERFPDDTAPEIYAAEAARDAPPRAR